MPVRYRLKIGHEIITADLVVLEICPKKEENPGIYRSPRMIARLHTHRHDALSALSALLPVI